MTGPNSKNLFSLRRLRPVALPTELSALCGFSAQCGCGKTHSVALKHAAIRAGAIEALIPIAREVGTHLSVALVVDRVTKEIAGNQIIDLLRSDGNQVQMIFVPDGAGGRPHADEPNLKLVEKGLTHADLGVSVGAGTLNDLTKLASFNHGIPYLSVATAPSMNGYTSAIAAILLRGVKRTVACHQRPPCVGTRH